MSSPLRLDYAVNDAEVIAAFKRQQGEMEKERKARQELEKQINSNASAQKSADKAATESAKSLATEQAKLAASAAKIAEAVRSPMQKYKAGLTELIDHYKSGRLTQDEYRASVDKLKESYNDATGKTAAAAAAEKAHTAAVKDATAIAEKYATKEERVAVEMKRLNDLRAKGVLSAKDYDRAVKANAATLDDVGTASDKSGGLIGGLTGKMAGFVGGLASAGTVITFLKSEYDALLERQGKSRDSNISLAAEQEALLMNLGGADSKEVTGQIRSLSQKSGIKEQDVTRAVNDAMAARGDMDVESVIDAVASAAKVRKFAPTELAGLAAATIDTQKQTGLGTDESLGFLMQMQAQSRTKDLKSLAANFTPAVGGIMNMGADRETAGGLLAALSHGMVDVSGEKSKTTGISLATQLRKYGQQGNPEIAAQMEQLDATHTAEKAALKADFDKRGIALNADDKIDKDDKPELRRQLAEEEKIKRDELKARQEEQTARLQDSAPAIPIADVIAKMQADPEYRKQFLKGKDEGGFGASFEAQALPAIESLLSGGTQATQYASAKAALTADPLDMLKSGIAARDTPAIRLAEKNQTLANVTDQAKLADTTGAESAISRENLREFRDQTGRLKMASKLSGVVEDFATGGQQTSEQTVASMEAELQMMRSGSTDVTRGLRAAGGGINPFIASRMESSNRSSPETQAQVKVLEELLAITKEQLETQKQQTDAQKQQAAGQAQGQHAGLVAGRANQQREGGQ
jgi:hypothetical protein